MQGVAFPSMPSRKGRLLGAACVAALLIQIGSGALNAAHAQSLNDRFSNAGSQSKGRLLVDAREIVYDNDREVVEARGDVQLYYQGRTLEADRVIYDRKTKRVYAEGNAKLTETNGQIVYSDRFELTDDFRDGFIDSLRVVSPDKQKISAARGERIDGETTVFERGIYTACETCKEKPEKPPLWQVKASRVIHKNSEQTLYFEDARLEFFGLPLAYIPYFSAPDPTVRRRSGVLAPRYFRSSTVGYGIGLPIYFAPAPHYDILWTPTYLTQQGLLNEVEWRHRLETGVYNIRAAGIFQQNPGAFLPGPFGPNRIDLSKVLPGGELTSVPIDNRKFRGSIETTGKFLLNDKWTFGWDVALLSDKYFLNNYKVKSESIQNTYFKESVSSVYLRGKTDRAYFDMTGNYFQGLTQADWQKQSAVVHPSIDYNRRFNPASIGGELTLDFNATSLSREQADYAAVPRTLAQSFQVPTALLNYAYKGTGLGFGLGCAIYDRTGCLIRGIGGNANRASASLSWRREFIDAIGQVWTPFISAQADVVSYSLNSTLPGPAPLGVANYSNNAQRNFLSDEATFGRIMPTVGLEYRFPLVAAFGNGSHVFEPIAQIHISPNEQKIGHAPNEDSHSLVFSDSNLFSVNRFSGYDRSEGGVRSNVGIRYTGTFDNGATINALFGQSYHIAGRNSFSGRPGSTDILNVGANSGLDKDRSDYVGRFAFAPNRTSSFSVRTRFDDKSFKLKRMDASASFNTGPLTTNFVYTRVDPQPELGYYRRREGAAVSASLKLPENWFVSGSLGIDLDRYLYDRDRLALGPPIGLPAGTKINSSPFRLSSYGLGISYIDECTTFSLQYIRGTSDFAGTRKSTSSTYIMRLELKHLGQVDYNARSGPLLVDGAR
jgi:LPS-assembly protein